METLLNAPLSIAEELQGQLAPVPVLDYTLRFLDIARAAVIVQRAIGQNYDCKLTRRHILCFRSNIKSNWPIAASQGIRGKVASAIDATEDVGLILT